MYQLIPTIRGVIDRRMLVNFRVHPDAAQKLLPAPFRPKLVEGWAMAGICLIRLKQIRPRQLPAALGITSENAAHRIAVEWDEASQRKEGVFIPRRDTDSLVNRLAGGRLFPGVHHAAHFRVWESGESFKLEMRSVDEETFVRVAARVTEAMPARSTFHSLAEASEFFRTGALGWSARPGCDDCDGLELRCDSWQIEPLTVDRVESSFFTNADLFPPGTVEFDSAFLMRNIEHEWHARGRLLTNRKDEL